VDEALHTDPRGSALAPHFDTESSYRLIYAYMPPLILHSQTPSK